MRALTLTALGALSLWACAPAELEAPNDEKPEAAELAPKIRNGTRSPTAVPLNAGQQLAIGWLHNEPWPGSNFCTGTVIGPRLVATASHCTENMRRGQFGFGVGQEPTAPRAVFDVVEFYEHPRRDAAILVLDRDVREDVPELEFIALNTVDPSRLVGTTVEAGGFGETFDRSRTGLWFAALALIEVDREFVIVDGQGRRGICFGDSGGPVISDRLWDGEPVVLGVEAFGSNNCLGVDNLTRVDAIMDWIEQVTAGVPGGFRTPGQVAEAEPEPEPEDPCGGLTYEGACDGDTAVWCADGQVRQRDCSTQGQTCGDAGPELGFYCIDRPPEPEPEPEPLCPGLGYEGACEGTVAVWCDGAEERRVDCRQYGARCAYTGPQYGFYCAR